MFSRMQYCIRLFLFHSQFPSVEAKSTLKNYRPFDLIPKRRDGQEWAMKKRKNSKESVPIFLLTCAKVHTVHVPPKFLHKKISTPWVVFVLRKNLSGPLRYVWPPCTVSGNGYAHHRYHAKTDGLVVESFQQEHEVNGLPEQ